MSSTLATQFENELHAIADWWMSNTVDEINGGFIGEMTVDNKVVANANKGIILNTRILWFFSEAACFVKDDAKKNAYQHHATRAYSYLVGHFVDSEHGGVFWELTAQGDVRNSRKQVYAQAFAIYALASYFKLTKDETALNLAYKIFELIETHAQDAEHEGYIEAFASDWSELQDFRLSEKDMNSPKSMNTHLHVLEAYSNLYAVDKHIQVANAMRRCLRYFDEHIINHQQGHLRMFQSLAWEDISNSWSYGHDIESSWLLWEAVELLHDEDLTKHFKPIVLQLAETCLQQGIGKHNEVLDAYNFKTKTLLDERVWWVQAEALVGFLTAWGMTNNTQYKNVAIKVWEFIQKYQKDEQGGEWHWLSTLDAPHVGDCKMGFWKGPYHNGRAMMLASKLATALRLD